MNEIENRSTQCDEYLKKYIFFRKKRTLERNQKAREGKLALDLLNLLARLHLDCAHTSCIRWKSYNIPRYREFVVRARLNLSDPSLTGVRPSLSLSLFLFDSTVVDFSLRRFI